MSTDTKKQAIIVLGMHRSGTSAMGGMLHRLGVDLGSHLMAAQAGVNEKGFYENLEFVTLHDKVLRELEYYWFDVRPFPENWWERNEIKTIQRSIQALIESDFSHSPLWGLKDPRMCRLLPLWHDIFDKLNITPHYVHISRHPDEVVASLKKRDNLREDGVYIAWLWHTLDAEAHTRGQKRVFITYEALLKDWQKTTNTIAKSLGLKWPKEPAGNDDFLDNALRHMHADTPNHSNAFAMLANELYAALQSGDPVDFDAFSIRFTAALDDHAAILSELNEVQHFRMLHAYAEQALQKQKTQYQKLSAQHYALRQLVNGKAILAPSNSCVAEDNKNIKASIIIPTKNAGKQFENVLDAVLSQITPWNYEVLVIDSGSSDGTVEYVKSKQNVRLHQIPANEFGHGKTRNLGISLTSGEFAVMITHDALPADNLWLYELVSAVEQQPEIAGAFGRHIAYAHDGPFLERDLRIHFASFTNEPVVHMTDPKRYKHDEGYRQYLHFFSDNNACLRRSVWEKIPYPEVDFAEDQIWAKAIIEAGYAKAYAHQAAVYHSHTFNFIEWCRRSFDEARALHRLFGYRVCPTLRHLIGQSIRTTVMDAVYLVRTRRVIKDFIWLVRAPLRNSFRQIGYYLGQRADKLPPSLVRRISRDMSLKKS